MSRLTNRGLAVGVVLLSGCAGATQRLPEAGTVPAITTADLERRLRIIADDSMMGRASGSAGDYKTAEYIAAEFRRLGLEPAGRTAPTSRRCPSGRQPPIAHRDSTSTATCCWSDVTSSPERSAPDIARSTTSRSYMVDRRVIRTQ